LGIHTFRLLNSGITSAGLFTISIQAPSSLPPNTRGPWLGALYEGLFSHPDWQSRDLAITHAGEPLGMVSGDFDHDGDQDFFLVNSTDSGIFADDGVIRLNGQPTVSQVCVNDSFGNFSELTNALSPNSQNVRFFVAKGDIDNDGDADIVTFKRRGQGWRSFSNQILQEEPSRSTCWWIPIRRCSMKQTQTVLSQHQGLSDSGPFGFASSVANVALKATVADFNLDGRPDIATAQGWRKHTGRRNCGTAA